MLYEPTTRPPRSWDTDPARDRIMLGLQYLTALIAVAAAGLLGYVR